jgi:sugar lactone lactonase YvrE
MWFTDTGVQTIFQAEWGPEGALGHVAPFTSGGMHDGLVRDVRGEFWGAIYGEGVVVHLDQDGDLIDRIAFPAPQLTGIAIGGPDMSTLLVGSARENMTDDELEQHPLSGGVFTVELDRTGRESFLFG